MSDLRRPPRVTQAAASWQAGYNAGTSGIGSLICPREIHDGVAYHSGYIEGEAARRRARAASLDRARVHE